MKAAAVLTLALAASSPSLPGCDAFAPPATANVGGGSRLSPLSFVSPALYRSSTRIDVSLSMGIRSFLKRKILRKKEGNDDEEGDSDDAEAVTLHSLLQSPGAEGLMESPLGMDAEEGAGEEGEEQPPEKKWAAKAGKKGRKSVDDLLGDDAADQSPIYEDAQERIRRMKKGGMTEEEKMAFLTNALKGPMPKEKPRGPPIRQKIPGMDHDDGEGSTAAKGAGGGPSEASAKENLWNAITRQSDAAKDKGGSSKKKEVSVASLMMDGKMKNEEAKRRYMESITNPDRFATFSVQQAPSPASSVEEVDDSVAVDDEDDAEMTVEEVAPVAQVDEEAAAAPAAGDDFAQMKRQIAEDRELLTPKEKQEQSAAREAVESILSMIGANNDKKAAEAGVNATATTASGSGGNRTKSTDHLAARLSMAAEEQEKRDAEARVAASEQREAERRARAEAQRQREEDLRRKEVERMEKARLVAEAKRREEEEREATIRREMEERQARQDAYWAKMLEKENARRERSEPVELKRRKEVLARDGAERMEREVAKGVAREHIREEERAREDPHEGEILKEAAEGRLRDREKARDIEEYTAARISNTVPQKSKEDVSASAFIREQQKKKEEIDRLRKLDEQSLKSLNSPLPSPGRMKRQVGVTPQIPTPREVPRTPPAPAPMPAPARSSSPDLSLSSLTMANKKDDDEAPSARTASPPPPPAPSQPLNLFEMTKLKQDADTTSTTKPAPKKRPAKRVVRQQLPISAGNNFDDDDEDDDLMRSGAPGLTVADALKQQRQSGGGSDGGASGGKKGMSAEDKAKQWGIDMSKFS